LRRRDSGWSRICASGSCCISDGQLPRPEPYTTGRRAKVPTEQYPRDGFTDP
jgi:hypothetical protein